MEVTYKDIWGKDIPSNILIILGPHIIVMINSIDLSQEIFAISMLFIYLKSSNLFTKS